MSVSSAAFASTRIEAMLMGTGSAAGVAAKQLVDGSAPTVQDVDVSAVQAVLTGTFGQTIHVPPPAPHPQYFNVSGAGDAVWNGQFARTEQTSSGEPVYVKTSSAGCPNQLPCSLYAWGGGWRLASEGKELFYTNRAGGPTRPARGWAVADGASPAPTLAAGPV
jgi:hypothetical protein